MTFGRSSALGRSAWGVLGLAVLAQFGISMIEQGVPLLTGFIKEDLDLSASTAGLVASSFAFGKIFGAYRGGLWADQYGERRVLVGGGVLTALFVALAAAVSGPAFVVLLVVAGVTGAVGTPAGGRIVLLAFPADRLGLALGIRQTAIPVAGIVAAALLPWIAHAAGWRWGLATAAAFTFAAAIPLALTRIEQRATAVAIVTPSGLRALLDRNLVLLMCWGCLLVTGQYALVAFLPLDIRERTGLSLAEASLFVVIANAFGMTGRIAWGFVSDRRLAHGRTPMLLWLTTVSLAGALLLATLPGTAPLVAYGVTAAVVGLGVIGFQGLYVTMVAEAAGPANVGAAMGLLVTISTAVLAASPPLFGLVADLTGTYRAIWIGLSVVVALSYLPALLLPNRPGER